MCSGVRRSTMSHSSKARCSSPRSTAIRAHASNLRSRWRETEIVLPATTSRREVADVDRGEPELEMHFGCQRIRSYGASQLVHDLVVAIERHECTGHEEACARVRGFLRQRSAQCRQRLVARTTSKRRPCLLDRWLRSTTKLRG